MGIANESNKVLNGTDDQEANFEAEASVVRLIYVLIRSGVWLFFIHFSFSNAKSNVLVE